MRPTYLEVDLEQLKQNMQAIRTHVAPAKVMAVLKANAYGHGVDGVAPFLAPFADYIGVALVEEAIHLRSLGIATPILVMGGTLSEQIPLFDQYNLTLAASSMELLAGAQQYAESRKTRLRVHLKIDTGMERIGVHDYEAEGFLTQSLKCKDLDVEGIFTHFSNSEVAGVDVDRSKDLPILTDAFLQLERFEEVLSFYEKRSLPYPELRHTANSGAILQLPQSHYDMVRPGVLLYGVYPARNIERKINVRPAIKWKSRVAYSKITRPGRGVSYGSLWRAEAESRIVTIPCGYADGYFRRMTNQAQVLINGKKYSQVGRICMDQFMVNAGDDLIQVGDEVTLFGDGITAEDLADWAGTNEYEVMTNISARVPRVYLGQR
jgi:alanine racemase